MGEFAEHSMDFLSGGYCAVLPFLGIKAAPESHALTGYSTITERRESV
jgi:hypothetical protein